MEFGLTDPVLNYTFFLILFWTLQLHKRPKMWDTCEYSAMKNHDFGLYSQIKRLY